MMRRLVVLGALALVAAGIVAVVVRARGPAPAAERGRELFVQRFTPEQGLGPLFNERSCAGCHLEPRLGGVGRDGLATVLRVGRLGGSRFDAMLGEAGPFAHKHRIAGLDASCARRAGIPAGANVTSVRNAPALFGSGRIDAIPDAVIRAGAVAKGDGVHGRVNEARGPDGRRRVGRFGWKGATPTLAQFVAEAFHNELGVTSELVPAVGETCGERSRDAEVDGDEVAAVTAFLARLPDPAPRRAEPEGARVFREAGCAACHVPALGGVELYSDLLIHDMGRALDDRVVQGEAGGADWRTTPLWGVSERPRLLHDGRAATLEAAILAHGGEAAPARARFRALTERQRRALLAFLRTL